MAANLKPIADQIEEQQFLLSARMHIPEQGETHMCGFVKGFSAALNRAQFLAATGWKVTIDPSDPNDLKTARIIVEPVGA